MGNRKFVYSRLSRTSSVDGYKKESDSCMVFGGRECARICSSDIRSKRTDGCTWTGDFGRYGISNAFCTQSAGNWIWRQLDDLEFRYIFGCVEIICSAYDCVYKCISIVWNRIVEKKIKKKESCSIYSIFDTGISGGLHLVRKECKASTIVEMAYLMPVILLMWMLVIFALFYYHDKTLVVGAAYETVVVGSEWYENVDEVEADRVGKYFQDRIRGKLLFFSYISLNVDVDGDLLVIDAGARKRGMRIQVIQKAEIRNPEKEIRRIQIIKNGLEDLKD